MSLLTSPHRLYVTQTAYCLTGHTRTGTRVHDGTIAVDPNIIPLGSRMYVPGYGNGRAEDTGGAIRGFHIDVWVASCKRAFTMTRYHVPILYWR